MNRRQFVATVGVAALGGCSTLNGDDEIATPTSGPEGGTTTVEMKTDGNGSYFDPIGLYLKPGDSVTFVVKSGNHSASAYHPDNIYAETTRIPEDAPAWGSKVLQKGESYEHTFNAVGTHDYYCIPHKPLGMVGRIIVGKPGGPADGSMPPDGEVPKTKPILEEESVSYEEFSG
ncbi:halocyanin precursor-like protein [Haladaptatus paucihalophilus DX253]|uniref:Halocyanin-like protein n=1 Tax=Haladaptatus paucihalophilus DX253 TaxID=797209 RepID=E7QW72_HALPU|nr:plastocyanin/azurin family copper-binding protein [Haladaptatus paucihalophilus]EFW91206.1 halocyanin precursor-like protein [Haladaptatus paucihalophilus DX253]SHL65350.1 Plastocyanin [Haladaptatus paucihalophilus DX253]